MTTKTHNPQPGDFDHDDSNPMHSFDATFDLETEAKDDPLVPQGTYEANVTKVWYDAERCAIKWQLTLEGNEAVMSDGETPVDGATVINSNWLPRPGDEDTPTASGRSTKRQSKINMLKKFADAMQIDMSTPKAIQEALINQEWLGLRAQVTVGLREYEGRVYNEVKSMKAI